MQVKKFQVEKSVVFGGCVKKPLEGLLTAIKKAVEIETR